jgi:hypothetical protein
MAPDPGSGSATLVHFESLFDRSLKRYRCAEAGRGAKLRKLYGEDPCRSHHLAVCSGALQRTPFCFAKAPVPLHIFSYFLLFRFRLRLLTSYGSGSGSSSDFCQVTVPVTVHAPYLDYQKHSFKKNLEIPCLFFTLQAFLQGKN